VGWNGDCEERPKAEAGWDLFWVGAKKEGGWLGAGVWFVLENKFVGACELEPNTDPDGFGFEAEKGDDCCCPGVPNPEGILNPKDVEPWVGVGLPKAEVAVAADCPNKDCPNADPPAGVDMLVVVDALVPNADGWLVKAEKPPPLPDVEAPGLKGELLAAEAAKGDCVVEGAPKGLVPVPEPNAPEAGFMNEDCVFEVWPKVDACWD
jgi:hypothetical protein